MNFDTNAAAETLVKAGFSTSQAAAIMTVVATTPTMQASAVTPAGLRPLKTPAEVAEDSQNVAQLRQVMAQCRRWGIALKHDQLVDLVALDASLLAAKADVESRLMIKTSMAAIRLIA